MIPQTIANKIGRNLHLQEHHPINLVNTAIIDYFNTICNCGVSTGLRSDHESQCQGAYCGRVKHTFSFCDDLPPLVSVEENFDSLLIPKDHPSRRLTDTYYQDESTVLRTHTTAHQTQALKEGRRYFLISGDCYRRDTVDAQHYPVFHQVDGVWVPPRNNWPDNADTSQIRKAVQDHLHQTLEGLARNLFGEKIKCRWSDDYFPFTNPSWELEIYYNGSWMEVLGCGLIQPEILENCGMGGDIGWAFGLGLDRLAMILYQIPDIRLLWSQDSRFLAQFKDRSDKIVFKPFSNHPPVYKDISFWISDSYHENDFYQLIRNVAGDLVEEVTLFDIFTHSKHGKTNHTYRITYRSMERSLTNLEINALQDKIREQVTHLDVELR